VKPFAYLWWDGERLSAERGAGRRMRADARCLAGDGTSAYAHVCALPEPAARLRYDEPEVQQARRDALAWFVPLLGGDFVCLTTLAVDASDTAGAITVARHPRHFADDPFARLFPGTIVETQLFNEVAPPVGPTIERYSGAPWPGGGFELRGVRV
jgi:hypothetical protein